MLDAFQIASKKVAINPLTLPTVESLSTSGKKTVIFLRWPIIKLSATWLIKTLKIATFLQQGNHRQIRKSGQ